MSQDSHDPYGQRPEEDLDQPFDPALPPGGQSRRQFLRAAVLSSAAAATVVGAGAALGPRLVGRVTAASGTPSCGGATLARGGQTNDNFIVVTDNAAGQAIQAGDCVLITNKTNTSKTQTVHIGSITSASNGIQLNITAYNSLSGDLQNEFPEDSCVTLTPCPAS